MTPLIMPQTPAGVARVALEIERIDFLAHEASGRQGGVQAGWPLWRGRWELGAIDPDAGDAWRAFLDRLRGRQRVFLGTDPTRPFPAAARGGFAGMTRGSGGAFGGAATGWGQALSDGEAQLALTGLPAGLPLAMGDYVGFRWDAAGSPAGTANRRAMVRVASPAVANGSGTVTLLVEPPIDTRVVPAHAVAHLDRPAALFRLDPDATKLGMTGAGRGMSGATIVAMQDLRP